jgi:putative NADPH-quinone reductase
MKKIYVLVGHPDTESMCRDLGMSYMQGAQARGHEVRFTNLGDSSSSILRGGRRCPRF